MKPEQLAKLEQLADTMADQFLTDADPALWSGSGKPPADMTQQERGDAYWCRKMAIATAGVLRYTLDLISSHADRAPDPAEEDALDAKVSDAYKRAQAAVKAAQNRAKEAAR